MESPYEADVKACITCMKEDGVLLYPTDTIWGLGCSALNEKSIEKIFEIKKRSPQKSFVLLMTDVQQLSRYIANPLPDLATLLQQFTLPTTVIYENAIGLPDAVIAKDGTVAVRITKDPFCRSLIKRLREPIVSTSANISGEPNAGNFATINEEIKNQVDYIVKWRQDEEGSQQASAIVKLNMDGSFDTIRK